MYFHEIRAKFRTHEIFDLSWFIEFEYNDCIPSPWFTYDTHLLKYIKRKMGCLIFTRSPSILVFELFYRLPECFYSLLHSHRWCSYNRFGGSYCKVMPVSSGHVRIEPSRQIYWGRGGTLITGEPPLFLGHKSNNIFVLVTTEMTFFVNHMHTRWCYSHRTISIIVCMIQRGESGEKNMNSKRKSKKGIHLNRDNKFSYDLSRIDSKFCKSN